MEAAEARHVLGVAPGAADDDVRAAYRGALRRTHPDLGGGDDAVRQVVAAYRTLVDSPPEPDPPPLPAATDPETVPVVTVAGDTVAAELPAGDLFAMLVEVGHGLGEVAYVDHLAGILEVVVTFEGYGACSVVLTLQGRATGTTEAFCTVVPLGAGPAPPVEAVAELLASGLRTLTA